MLTVAKWVFAYLLLVTIILALFGTASQAEERRARARHQARPRHPSHPPAATHVRLVRTPMFYDWDGDDAA